MALKIIQLFITFKRWKMDCQKLLKVASRPSRQDGTKFPSNYVRSATLYEILLFMLWTLIVYNFLIEMSLQAKFPEYIS